MGEGERGIINDLCSGDGVPREPLEGGYMIRDQDVGPGINQATDRETVRTWLEMRGTVEPPITRRPAPLGSTPRQRSEPSSSRTSPGMGQIA